MPKSLDPSSRITMVLASDVDKPPETRPRIFARTMSINQHRRMMDAMERMRQCEKPVDKLTAALDAAEICIIGWENMVDCNGNSIPCTRESIGDVLTIDELVEVFDVVSSQSAASAADKKKSG